MSNYIKDKLNVLTKKYKNITEIEFLLENIPPLSENGPWVAGGCLLRTKIGEKIDTDIDLFFKDKSQFEKYRTDLLNSTKLKVLEERASDWCVNIDVLYKGSKYKIQLINKMFFHSAPNLLDSFDLNICQIAYDGKFIFIAETTMSSIEERKMQVNKVTYPKSFMMRCMKYSKLGFSLSMNEVSNFFDQIKNKKIEIEQLSDTKTDYYEP